MFIKIFEGKTAQELETNINSFLESDQAKDYDLHSLLQSESMIEINGKLERRITMTCIMIEQLFNPELFDDTEEE